MVLPDPGDDRARQLDELGLRATPGAEFFLFALLSGLVFGAALLLNSPAMAVLAALLVPFMGPVLGLSLGSVAGSTGFFLRSLVSLLTGGLIFFLTTTLAGWATRLVPALGSEQAVVHLQLGGPDLALLTVGVSLSMYLLVKSPTQRPMVSSVAIAYELFLPLGAAGYAITSQSGLPWAGGLLVFAAHLAWAVLVGALTLALLGLRPLRAGGTVLVALMGLVCLGAALFYSGVTIPFQLPAMPALAANPGAAPATAPVPARQDSATPVTTSPAPQAAGITPSPSLAAKVIPTVTLTPTASATRTLVPTSTPTQTVTPQATPVWARINAKGGNGAYIREKPNYDAPVVQPLLNGYLVQVLEDVTASDQTIWVKVRTDTGKEGWIVRSLLATATPAPGW